MGEGTAYPQAEYSQLLEQLGYLRGRYGVIAEREDNARMRELLGLLDRAVDGEDVRGPFPVASPISRGEV